MTIKSPENLIKALDFLCQNTSPSACAKSLGAHQKLIWQWLSASASDADKGISPANSEWGVRWPDPDAEPIFFHDAVQQARKIFLALATMEITSELTGPNAGTRRVVVDAGRVQWTPSPKVASDALTMDDDTWELVYGKDRKRTDIWERDTDGHLIPLTVVDPLPAAYRIHLLRSLLPSQFNPTDRSTKEVLHAGGVMVLHGRARAKPEADTPLLADLHSRLAQLRADPNRATARPTAPVDYGAGGKSASDPPEKISGVSFETEADFVPSPSKPEPPKQEAPVNYGRPRANERAATLDQASVGRGRPPAGGVSLTTGRAS